MTIHILWFNIWLINTVTYGHNFLLYIFTYKKFGLTWDESRVVIYYRTAFRYVIDQCNILSLFCIL